MENHYFRK